MRAYRPERVIRVLNVLVTIAYVGVWIGGVLVLVGMPAVRLLAGDDPDWTWGLQVPVTLQEEAAVHTTWGAARLEVEEVRADLRLPIGLLPWGLFALLWAHFAAAFALTLLFVHHLRRIFQSVRAGAPFDSENARRLRSLGVLLIALALLNGLVEILASIAVRGALVSDSLTIPIGIGVDGWVVVIALVLVSLAEIFRRGAELEDEQALVV